MKILKLFVFLFITSFCVVHSEDFPRYRMVDLGLFETDYSSAYAINENNELLGVFSENENKYCFIWNEVNGLKIFKFPEGYESCRELKFNNKGQIVGVFFAQLINHLTLFYWDITSGFWEIESLNENSGNLSIYGFNDKGQILGSKNNQQLLLWDHGKIINILEILKKQVPGNWGHFGSASLNNQGYVAFSVYEKDLKKYISFFWNGSFKLITLNKEMSININICSLDDDDNMILSVYPLGGNGNIYYFMSASNNISVPCQLCDSIRNGFPVAKNCLPGTLKNDRQGNLYYSQGIQIKKLLEGGIPFYDISHTASIIDQNSKKYAAGSVDTLYGHHAFLAIPEFEKN
jgi:hypothetical protein